MSESYLTLSPSYFTGHDPRAARAHVSVILELSPTVTGPGRLALWSALMAHLARTGSWDRTETDAAIAAWLAKVDAQGYAARITSSIMTARPLDIVGLDLAGRVELAGELLDLAAGFPARLRALELLDFVGAGVSTPARPPEAVARRLADPAPWADAPADRAALRALARAALAVESWPGNRVHRYIAARPGLAPLL